MSPSVLFSLGGVMSSFGTYCSERKTPDTCLKTQGLVRARDYGLQKYVLKCEGCDGGKD